MGLHDGVHQVSRLKKELLVCSEERDSAQLDKELLSNRLKHMESELDREKSSQTDHSREMRLLEVCLCVDFVSPYTFSTGTEAVNLTVKYSVRLEYCKI